MQVSDYKLLVIVKASEWLLTYRERMIYMFLQEIKEMFKSKVLIAGLIVAILIPTLYSATFLWAFWNPYDYTENLKVAVVNEDQPVSIEDKEIDFGDQIIQELASKKDFDWQFVDKSDAMNGLEDNSYSMMIKIPKDFSQKVSTIFTEKPEQPIIYNIPNEAKNYMISMIQGSMMQQLKSEVSNKITESYMTLLAESLSEAENGMIEINESSNQLIKGLEGLETSITKSLAMNQVVSKVEKDKIQNTFTETISNTKNLSQNQESKLEEGKNISLDKKNIQMRARPLELKETPYTEVENYGNGFVPFTLSLGLFIGAMVLTIIFPVTKPLTTPRNGWNWFVSKYSVIAVVAIIQAIIADIVLIYGLEINVESTGMFFLFTIIASLTLMTILHFISALFKEAGRLLIVLMIILQITSSGGTFPSEMVPSILQKLSTVLPMTYTIKGFRSLVANDQHDLMWQQVGSLSIFFVITLIGTVLYFQFAYRKSIK